MIQDGTAAMQPVRDGPGGVLVTRRQSPVLPLDNASVRIEWQAAITEDDLACVLLQLVGEASLQEIFDD